MNKEVAKITDGIYNDMSNTDYHAVLEGEERYYSSSQLKDMLEDPELFYRKYISKELNIKKENPAFEIGTNYHTAILEPEKLKDECIVWEGGTRRGKKWDEFKERHKDKSIITLKEVEEVQNLIDATHRSPVAMDLLSEGIPEQSLFTTLMGVKIKVRFDWLSLQNGYIVDLKSSRGNVKNEHTMRSKTSSFQYDLSAALYLDAINQWIKENKPKGIASIKRFYWIYASKDIGNCQTYQASDKNIAVGRAKYQKALRLIKYFSERNWKFDDEIRFLQPNPWEVVEWLDASDETPKQVKGKPAEKKEEAIDAMDIL